MRYSIELIERLIFMKNMLIFLFVLVLVLSSCSVNQIPISDDHSLIDTEAEGKLIADEVTYNSILADWPVYDNVEALVEASDAILQGKVSDISFQVMDDRIDKSFSGETNEQDYSLYTIYDVDIIDSYKGDFLETSKVRVLGGLEGVHVDEQLEALGDNAQKGITIIKGKPEIKLGETYLFVLYQYEDTIPTLVNMEQGVYEIGDSLKKDWYSFISTKDIISYFGEDKWDEFNDSLVKTEEDHSSDSTIEYDTEKINSGVLEGNQKFAFDIFKLLNEEDSKKSIFISPLSISQALTMAYNGAETTTKESMEEALSIVGLDRAIVNESFRNLINHLEQIDKNIELSIGNSIWIRDNQDIPEEFIRTNQENLNADVESLDFTDDKAVEIINAWIDNATKGKISKMLEPPILEDIIMYLINAIYFKGEWKEQFDPKLTYQDNFNAHNGEVQTVNMMRKSEGTVEFTSCEKYKAVRLPYGNDKTSMYIILPSEGTDINEFISNMTLENWKGIKSTVTDRKGIVFRIPRFKLEYGTKSLKDSLISLGMEEAFSDHADFTGISEKITISDVMHRAVIEVNEEGSEAAAATEVVAGGTSVAEPITFIANRPFMFIINDDIMDTILFMGKVVSIDE